MAIKMGIIGFGGMGRFHQWMLESVDGIEVVAAHDIQEEALEEARKRGMRAYEKREDLLADPEIQLVLVATPNEFHKPYVIEAARAGKHIISEKPVTFTVADLDEMDAAAKEAGVIFTVHHNRRWDRDFLKVRKAIQTGMLGKVYCIESRVTGSGGLIYGWRAYKEHAGGMIYDWGVHLIDQILQIYPDNRLKTVFAKTFHVHNSDVDDYFRAEMLFDNGVEAHVEMGTFLLIPAPRWYVQGDNATMMMESFDENKGKIVLSRYMTDEVGNTIVNTPSGPTRTLAPQPADRFEDVPLPEVEGEPKWFYLNLIDAINGKCAPAVTIPTVRRTLAAMEKIFESAQTGRSVECDL